MQSQTFPEGYPGAIEYDEWVRAETPTPRGKNNFPVIPSEQYEALVQERQLWRYTDVREYTGGPRKMNADDWRRLGEQIYGWDVGDEGDDE